MARRWLKVGVLVFLVVSWVVGFFLAWEGRGGGKRTVCRGGSRGARGRRGMEVGGGSVGVDAVFVGCWVRRSWDGLMWVVEVVEVDRLRDVVGMGWVEGGIWVVVVVGFGDSRMWALSSRSKVHGRTT